MSANISSVEGDENLCRVCMVSGSKRKTLLSIFDKLPNDKTTFVEAFTALELGGQPQDITNDDFTKKVCKKCTEEVQKVYNSVTNLRQKCQETHLKLTEIANCQKIEAVDVIIKEEGHDEYVEEILPAEILNVVVKKETPEEEVLVKKKNARAKSSARKTTLRTPESSSLPPEPIKPKIRRMRNSKLNFCCKCKETFVHEKDLNAHFQIAHANKIKEFQIDELPPDSNKSACTLCKMMVVRMQQHRRQKHYTIQKRAPSKLNLCKYCGKVYISYAGVYICEKRHESEVDKQTFQCPKCPKTFPMIQRLRKHMKFHSEKFPFTCEVCGRKYRDSSKLKLHQIKHSDEKKYKCDICQKEMKHQSTLRFHMKVHTGVMDHHCEYCSKSFYRTTELKRHRAIHMKHMARASAQLNDFQPTP